MELDHTVSLNYAEAVTGDNKLRLIKPLTYMNLSGKALAELADKYCVDIADTYVIYDDIDIPMGNIRIRKKGGAGTHNGMRSIISYLGSEEFPRIRVGVKSETAGSYDSLADYVLGPLDGDALNTLMEGVQCAGDAVLDLSDNTLDIVMNKYNRKIKSSGSEPEIPCSL